MHIPVNSLPGSITAGPDGNVWFTESLTGDGAARIGRVTPRGNIREFNVPGNHHELTSITAGPDGDLWFTDSHLRRSMIGRITQSGAVT